MKYSEIRKPWEPSTPKVVKWNDIEIKVRQNITSSEVYDIVMITLQESKEGTIYNKVKTNIYFHLNLLFTYADITFDEGERADMFALYDEVSESGLLEAAVGAIPTEQYEELRKLVTDMIETMEIYGNSVAGVIESAIADLPGQAEAAMKIVNDFDPEKYQAVIDFANAANGGRNFKTNEPLQIVPDAE